MNNSEQPINPIANSDGFCTSHEYLKQPDGGAIGLTKREYFAAMAMRGLITNQRFIPNIDGVNYLVEQSVKCADELLKQLEK